MRVLEQSYPAEPIHVLVRQRREWAALAWARAYPRVSIVEGELRGRATWILDGRWTGLRGIFHLAALVRHSRDEAEEVFRVNVGGTDAIAALAARTGARLVFVSTSGTVACFPDAATSVDEEAVYLKDRVAKWPYYASKIAAEKHLRENAARLNFPLVIIRPPVLLGPEDHRLRSSAQILRFMRGRLPFLIEGGMHFVDIRDAAAAIAKAMFHPHPKPIYHLPGTACRIQDFFHEVGRYTGQEAPRLLLPYRLAWLLASCEQWFLSYSRKKRVSLMPHPVLIEMARHHWNMSSLYAREDLDFVPRLGAKTLHDTVMWLQEHVN